MVLETDSDTALDVIRQWWQRGSSKEFRLGGLAGTGKTTIVTRLAEVLRLSFGDIRYVAPTGKAANVLTRKLPSNCPATTIHSLMYSPREFHCKPCPAHDEEPDPDSGRAPHCHGYAHKGCECGLSFAFREPNPMPRLIVVDEASMVGEDAYDDLCSLDSRVVYVGDHGQLPPVRAGRGVMDEETLDVRLNKIHRQAADSPIIQLAMDIREGAKVKYGERGPGVHIVRMGEYDWEQHYDPNTLLLCYTNRRRTQFNEDVRHLRGYAGEPALGERLICLRNNHEAGIVNGMLGDVVELQPRGPFTYRAAIALLDEDRVYRGVISRAQFTEAKPVMERHVDLWTYGYCLTVHKAQGSEADKVVVWREGSVGGMSKAMQRRWLYTAVTRAKQELTVVA